MKRKNRPPLWALAAIPVPCILATAFFFVTLGMPDVRVLLVLLHVLTLIWAVVFLKNKLFRVALLPISFLLSLAGPFLYDTMHPGMFQYLRTAAMAAMYALPWTAVTLVVAAMALWRQKRRRRTIDYEL